MAWTPAQVKAADPGGAIGAALATLNGQTVASAPVDLPWSSIRDVLMNNFDWGTLVQCASAAVGTPLPGGALQSLPVQAAAAALRECCLYGGTFVASNAAAWAKLSTAAGLLTPTGVGGISAASATAVTALRTPTLPVWQPALTIGDLQTARAQP